jgi:GT2 family glycosyltransferase
LINVSIVLFNNSADEVAKCLSNLLLSVHIKTIYVVDNSPSDKLRYVCRGDKIVYDFNPSNPGYGAAHNVGIRRSLASEIDYHLVLNADVDFKAEIISNLVDYMDSNPTVGQLMPLVLNSDGTPQKCAKLVPTPFDLFIRMFVPGRFFKKRRSKFTLDAFPTNKTFEAPYLSGCFMFLRVETLRKVGLFDERFFMYPEDIDLTRRIHKHSSAQVFPLVSIVHHHGKASHRSIKMLFIHCFNIIKYFNKWGWIFDKDRDEQNRRTLSQLKNGAHN